MRRIMIITATAALALAACGSSGGTVAPETTTTTSTAPTATLQQCADALNVAKNNVVDLASNAPMAIITEGSPAGAAAKMHALAAENQKIVDNAANTCQQAGGCGTANIAYLNGMIDSVNDIADGLTGSLDTTPTTVGDFPVTLTCP